MEDDSSKDKRKKVKTKAGKTAGEKSGQAWLHEGDSEEIMDFMDINAAKKVMGRWSILIGFVGERIVLDLKTCQRYLHVLSIKSQSQCQSKSKFI